MRVAASNLIKLDGRALLLFVPATRPERFVKAIDSGADGVIIDLEDAVATQEKEVARETLEREAPKLISQSVPLFVRINAVGTRWHEADVAALARLAIAGVMLPKAESADDLQRLRESIGRQFGVIALVETARGVACARRLAETAGRIAFGSLDYAADIGATDMRDALLHARSELVLASRLAGLPAPLDGVTTSIDDQNRVVADAAYAASLGFAGKLLIHPRQVPAAAQGFSPAEEEIAWANRVVMAVADGGVTVLDGAMLDAPVIAQARQILIRAGDPTGLLDSSANLAEPVPERGR